MIRRDFLKAFTAAAAALAGGGAAATGLSPLATPEGRTKVKAAISAQTRQMACAIEDSRKMLRQLIKECRVVSWEKEFSRYAAPIYRVTFRHAPDEAADLMCDELKNAVEKGAIRDARIDCYSDIDVTHLGDPFGALPLERPRYEVVVSYIVAGSA